MASDIVFLAEEEENKKLIQIYLLVRNQRYRMHCMDNEHTTLHASMFVFLTIFLGCKKHYKYHLLLHCKYAGIKLIGRK